MAERSGERPVKVGLARRMDAALERSDGSREDSRGRSPRQGVQVHWSAGKDHPSRRLLSANSTAAEEARWKGRTRLALSLAGLGAG